MVAESGRKWIFPNMGMSIHAYKIYCQNQKGKKVLNMCKPLSEIQNLSAQQLLEYCGQAEKIPVDIKGMLKKLNISCLPYDFTEWEEILHRDEECKENNHILGALVTKGNNAAIFYSADEIPGSHRYRFTIAHELAHCCLSHHDITRESSVHLAFRHEGESTDPKEVSANIFAGELLIPQAALEDVIHELILPSVQSLADIFSVSKNVMLARLDYLKVGEHISGYNY